jgi:hypothetical protein
MKNIATEVPSRKRSSPCEFTVTMMRSSESRILYLSQMRQVLVLAGCSSSHGPCANWFSSRKYLAKELYGSFTTELESGRVLHVPSGKCIEWTVEPLDGDRLAEKLPATTPGMPGPLPHSN